MKGQISDYNRAQIIGTGRRNRRNRRSKKRMVALVFALLFALSALTFALVLYRPFNIVMKKRDFYMLILTRSSTNQQAQTDSQLILEAGGAGLILNDGDFLTAAFVYTQRNAAETIKNRMSESYPDSHLKTLTFKKQKIKRFGNRNAEKKLQTLLEHPFATLDAVLKLVYALDSFESTESATLLEAAKIEAALKSNLDSAKSIMADYPQLAPAKQIALFFDKKYDEWQRVTVAGQDSPKLSPRLKNFACALISDFNPVWHSLTS